MITFLQMCRGVGLLLGLGLVGCTKPPVPVAVAQPRLGECRASDHAVELGLDAPALCRLATERGKLLVRNEGDPFRVKLRIVRATADASHLELVLTLEEERPDGRRIEQRAAAAGKPGSAPAELARRLTGDVLEELGARLRLYYDPPPDVVAALAATNPDLKQEAIEVCGERKLMACTETLLPLLRSEDLELRDRVVAVLARIGDRRAVRPITEVSKFGQLDELPKVLDAVARIGGPEARAYLEFVAHGHDQKEVRELAKKQLERLGR